MAVLDIRQTLLSAATTGHGTAVDLGGQTESILVYLDESSGISAGKVQVETAPTTDYAGTWAAIGSEQTLVASTVLTVAAAIPFSGSGLYIIKRILLQAIPGWLISFSW